MLSQRLVAGLVMVVGFLAALLYLPGSWFHLLLSVFALVAAWEWARLITREYWSVRLVFLVACGLVGFVVYWVIDESEQRLLLFTTCLYWGAMLFFLSSFHADWIGRRSLSWFSFFTGILFIPMGWWSLFRLYEQGKDLFVYLMLVVWVADSAAYFCGRSLGKHKLVPQLSPGKTIEGVGGAVLMVLLLALLGSVYFSMSITFSLYFVFLSLAVMLISVVGDLFESMLKRNAHVKDSGSIIPGHGGILDRIDSLIAAAPVFALGVYWL